MIWIKLIALYASLRLIIKIMFRKNIALAVLATAACARESSFSCPTFKEYVEDQYDCGYDYIECKNIVRCDTYVCDGTSLAEKRVSKGGLLYELNCGSKADYNTWKKVCELEKSMHPDD